jgi:hypothetical protein
MLAQLALASSAADLAATGTDELTRQTAHELAERCILSVAAALCAMTGLERGAGVAERYMLVCCDKLADLTPEAA